MNNIRSKTKNSLSIGNPAESLLGMTLDGGWIVTELLKKKPCDTGGHFSVCYTVKRGAEEAFLKALDLTDALQQPDFVAAINNMTTAFMFERDLLEKCKGRHLSKVVRPLENGQISISGQPAFNNVYYIIFEKADSNIRIQIAKMQAFDLALILRSLHHTSIAIEQLHKNGIAHQDLKPSNVLVFQREYKVGDLGRSSDSAVPSMNDRLPVPGDQTYAPFDLFYNSTVLNNFQLRYASDLYHLGSLIFVYFLNANLKTIIWSEMIKNNLSINLTRTDFHADLPFFQEGFTYALKLLSTEVKNVSPSLETELLPLVKMLCEIDPQKRGHTENIRTNINQYSLERFISAFDILAKKAEYKLYEHV
jgi:serine/threonine protein kinase